MSKEPIPLTPLHKTFLSTLIFGIIIILAPAVPVVLGQSIQGAPASSSGLELPVIFRKGVESGRTPVGTRVQARLTVATLVNGAVVPEGAKLNGEVTESVAGSGSGTGSTYARLSIQMDSADWKTGSKPTTISFTSTIYLTAWYYPLASFQDPTLSDDQPNTTGSAPRRRNGSGGSSDPTARPTPPFPPSTADVGGFPDPAPPAAKSNTSQHRVLMKDVEAMRNTDGSVTLTSSQSKIKLDTSTTYVLSSADLLPKK